MTTKAVASVAARRRARELSARYQQRELLLVQAAADFLAGQEGADRAVADIDQQILRLQQQREQLRRAEWETGAAVARRMQELGARADEIGARLGVKLSEVRRLLVWAKGGGARGEVAAGTPGQRTRRRAHAGTEEAADCAPKRRRGEAPDQVRQSPDAADGGASPFDGDTAPGTARRGVDSWDARHAGGLAGRPLGEPASDEQRERPSLEGEATVEEGDDGVGHLPPHQLEAFLLHGEPLGAEGEGGALEEEDTGR